MLPDNSCEFGICKEYQHCCGDNVCCDINEISLNGILFLTFVTIVIGMLCLGILYKYRENIQNFYRKMYRRMCRRCATADYTDMGSDVGMENSNQKV